MLQYVHLQRKGRGLDRTRRSDSGERGGDAYRDVTEHRYHDVENVSIHEKEDDGDNLHVFPLRDPVGSGCQFMM